MATSLEFDLDNFDLETIDMTNSSNNTGLGLSSMKTSTSTPTSISGLDDGDTFGLDLLMNKSKAKLDSHKSSSTQSIQHPSTNEPKQSGDGLFNKLFNNNKKTTPVINKLGAFNNNVANGSNGGLQDIDLDVELKNLDIGLDDTLNKAKNMNGPGLPKFGSSPISSMPTSLSLIHI